MMKPSALYVLFDKEFEVFASTIERLKTPLGYVLLLGKHIWKKKFGGLKLHDYHVKMQQVMPLVHC
jgi:hypothetical protein